MPGKLRGNKKAGDDVIAAINANLNKNWVMPLVQGGSVTADYFNPLGQAVSPFLNGNPKVMDVFQTIGRDLQAFVSATDTSPAVIAKNLSTLRTLVKNSGAALDDIYSDLVKNLKS